MAKPTKYPRWASDDIVDIGTGQNNVVEPNETKKNLGFGPAGEFPLRQHFNWLFRLIYDWIVWLEEQVTGVLPVQTGTFEAKVTTSDFDSEYTFDLEWQKNGNIVNIKFPVLFHPGDGSSTRIRIKPSGASEWPAELLPSASNENNQPFYVFVDSGGSIVRAIGSIEIPSGDTADWDVSAPDANGNLSDTNFTTTNSKGWESQTITYSTI